MIVSLIVSLYAAHVNRCCSFPVPVTSGELLNCTSAPVLELQELMLEYSHDSRLQTGELHKLQKTDE